MSTNKDKREVTLQGGRRDAAYRGKSANFKDGGRGRRGRRRRGQGNGGRNQVSHQENQDIPPYMPPEAKFEESEEKKLTMEEAYKFDSSSKNEENKMEKSHSGTQYSEKGKKQKYDFRNLPKGGMGLTDFSTEGYL
jgi:hypothetical protein